MAVTAKPDEPSCCCSQVTDASGASLASHCPSLVHVKLTKAMTDSTIKQLAKKCPSLQEAHLHRYAWGELLLHHSS